MSEFGLFRYGDLVAELGRYGVRRSVQTGLLVRVAHGWYAAADKNPLVARHLRSGTQLAGLAAAKVYGLWTPPQPTADIAVLRGTPIPAGDTHQAHRVRKLSNRLPVVPLIDALRQVVRWHDPEIALICLESAVNSGRLRRSQAESLIAAAPKRCRSTLQFFNPLAESGTETRARLFFQRRGVPARAQVSIAAVGRVDLLIGDSLVIECDSRAHHTSLAQYESDRVRDLELHKLRYRCVRLTYHQVFVTWERTQNALSQLLASREHVRRCRRGQVDRFS